MKKFINYLKDYKYWESNVYMAFVRQHKKFFIFEFIYFVFSMLLSYLSGLIFGYIFF